MKLILDYAVWKEIAYLFETLSKVTETDGGLELDLNAYTTKIEIHCGEDVNKVSIGAVIDEEASE